MVPHRMVGWNGYNTAMCWQLREDDVSPIFTPLYHAGGLGAFLLPIFAIGGTIVLHAGFDAEEIWRTIERERCTVVLGVPTIYKLLMEAPAFQTVDLSHVRWLISGGAPLPLYIIEAYQQRGVVFKQGYGLTEVGVNCFSMTVDESVRKKGSIGKPMMFTEARAAGPDGREVPAGDVGELWLRGPHVCKGYWNNPEATAAALDADGWFHTGDLARRDEEGFYYIAGRQKDMLISGGVNIYPAEIEAELLLHPAVQDAAVVGLPDPTWGEIGAGCVVLREAGSVTGEELAAFLSARLAKYKIPRRWLFLDALPAHRLRQGRQGGAARPLDVVHPESRIPSPESRVPTLSLDRKVDIRQHLRLLHRRRIVGEFVPGVAVRFDAVRRDVGDDLVVGRGNRLYGPGAPPSAPCRRMSASAGHASRARLACREACRWESPRRTGSPCRSSPCRW